MWVIASHRYYSCEMFAYAIAITRLHKKSKSELTTFLYQTNRLALFSHLSSDFNIKLHSWHHFLHVSKAPETQTHCAPNQGDYFFHSSKFGPLPGIPEWINPPSNQFYQSETYHVWHCLLILLYSVHHKVLSILSLQCISDHLLPSISTTTTTLNPLSLPRTTAVASKQS